MIKLCKPKMIVHVGDSWYDDDNDDDFISQLTNIGYKYFYLLPIRQISKADYYINNRYRKDDSFRTCTIVFSLEPIDILEDNMFKEKIGKDNFGIYQALDDEYSNQDIQMSSRTVGRIFRSDSKPVIIDIVDNGCTWNSSKYKQVMGRAIRLSERSDNYNFNECKLGQPSNEHKYYMDSCKFDMSKIHNIDTSKLNDIPNSCTSLSPKLDDDILKLDNDNVLKLDNGSVLKLNDNNNNYLAKLNFSTHEKNKYKYNDREIRFLHCKFEELYNIYKSKLKSPYKMKDVMWCKNPAEQILQNMNLSIFDDSDIESTFESTID